MKKILTFFSRIFFFEKKNEKENEKKPVKIMVEEQPNENYLSFYILKEIDSPSFVRERLYDSFRDKQALKIIHPIESVQGVARVWIRREKILTVTVMKTPFVNWAGIKPSIIEAIKEVFDLDEAKVEDASQKESFDTKIRRLYIEEFEIDLFD